MLKIPILAFAVFVLLTACVVAQSSDGAKCTDNTAFPELYSLTFCEVTLLGKTTHTITECRDGSCEIRKASAEEYERRFNEETTRTIEVEKIKIESAQRSTAMLIRFRLKPACGAPAFADMPICAKLDTATLDELKAAEKEYDDRDLALATKELEEAKKRAARRQRRSLLRR